jgi:hypothetical protein
MSAPFFPPSPSAAERASFAEPRKRLPAIWQEIHSRPHTSVVVPSLSFDSRDLAKIQGEPFNEERLLFRIRGRCTCLSTAAPSSRASTGHDEALPGYARWS